MTSRSSTSCSAARRARPSRTLEQRHMDLAASIQRVTEEVHAADGRDAAPADRHEEPRAWPAAWRSTAWPTAGCCARDRSRTSGSSRRPATPAARSAPRCSSGISCWSKPRQPHGARRAAGQLLGPGVLDRRSRRSSWTRSARAITRFDDEAALLDRRRRPAGRRQGRRLVPRPRGVRPARARRAQHPRRRPLAEMQAHDEPEDQVPGELPPVRAVRAARARARVVRDAAGRGLALHAHGRAGARRSAPCRSRPRSGERSRHDPDLVRRVNVARSTVPAITHVDYSARVQTVDERHGRFHRLMKRFHELTGCPVLVNTSFNLSWEPIVLTPEEAYHTFMQSEMDVLVLEDCRARQERAAARPDGCASPERRASSRPVAIEPVGRSRAPGDPLRGRSHVRAQEPAHRRQRYPVEEGHSAPVRADRPRGRSTAGTSPISSSSSTRRRRSRTTTISTRRGRCWRKRARGCSRGC